MANKILVARGTKARLEEIKSTLAANELVYSTDTGELGVKKANGNIEYFMNATDINAKVDPNAMAYFDYAGSIYGDKYSLLPNAWEHSFTVDPTEISADGFLGDNGRGKAQYPNGETEGVIIPQGVSNIGSGAFSNWKANNQPLVIPNSVTSIGTTAFYAWQTNTHPLVIPDSVTSIESYTFAFWYANNQPLTIPNSVTSIEVGAFQSWYLVPYIEMKSTTPPSLASSDVFGEQNDAPIYVPDESVDDYKTATNWVNLADRIFPISDKVDLMANIEGLKLDIQTIEQSVDGLENSKVDKVPGKGLSAQDYTLADKYKLYGIQDGAQVNEVNSVNDKQGVVVLNQDDIGDGETYKQVSQAEKNTWNGKSSLNTPISELNNHTLREVFENGNLLDKEWLSEETSIISIDSNGNLVQTSTDSYFYMYYFNHEFLSNNNYYVYSFFNTNNDFNNIEITFGGTSNKAEVLNGLSNTEYLMSFKGLFGSGNGAIVCHNNFPNSTTNIVTNIKIGYVNVDTLGISTLTVAQMDYWFNVYRSIKDKGVLAHIETKEKLTNKALDFSVVNNTKYPTVQATKTELDKKVNKVTGKGLSTNDYTTTEKNKLAGIASGAEVNVQSDWNATSGDALILNKPAIPNKVSDLTNDTGYITGYTETDPIFTAWNKSTGISITKAQVSDLIEATQTLSGLMSSTDKTRLDVLHSLLEEDTENSVVDSINEVLAIFNNYPEGADLVTALAGKVDKVSGMGLSTNDFTTNDKNKLDGIEAGAEVNEVNSVNGQTGAVVLDAEDVGALPDDTPLFSGDYDDLSNKPELYDKNEIDQILDVAQGLISDIQVDIEQVDGRVDDLEVDKVDKVDIVDNLTTNDATKVLSAKQGKVLQDNKVDKVAGKGLSTNDYTTTEKNKLAGIAVGAEVNVQSNWTQDVNTADDYIKNKPAIPTKVSDLTNDTGYITGYTETDPIFTAWNKSTGISITKSQVSDLIEATQSLSGLMSATDKTRLDVLHALLEEDTANNVVDSINEVLSIFNNYPEGADLVTALAGKVDKVSGKGLSTNDLTNTLKSNYDTAYGWGNHAVEGYLKSITKAMVEAVLTGTITSHDHDGTYEPAFTKNTAFNKNFGTSAGTVAQGNHLHTGVYEPANANIQAHISSTFNPHGVTKSQVGLGNVENKSSADIRSELSSSNITTALGYTPYNATNPNNYITSAQAPVQSVSGKTGAVTLVKGDVGLGNVDNIADVNKYVQGVRETRANTNTKIWTGTQAQYDAIGTKDTATLYFITD